MDKKVRIDITQEDNPRGALVSVNKSIDGITWQLVLAWRISRAIALHHPWNPDDVPNEYIHVDIIRRVNELVAKGYKFVA